MSPGRRGTRSLASQSPSRVSLGQPMATPESRQQFRETRSATMMRVPGSSGDSGFHRKSTEEDDVKIKMEPEIGVPTEGESPLPPLKQEGHTDRPGAGRSSGDVNEEDPALVLEMKPQPPAHVSSGTPPRGRRFSGESQRTFSHKFTPPSLVPDQGRRRLRR
jgi:hypothetical protein